MTPDGVVTTVAGAVGVTGTTDGMGPAARFHVPVGVAVDGDDNVLIADTANQVIRKLDSNGNVTTIAGSAGTTGHVDANGLVARFNNPQGVANDTKGNLYVADYSNRHQRDPAAPPRRPAVTRTGRSRGRLGAKSASLR